MLIASSDECGDERAPLRMASEGLSAVDVFEPRDATVLDLVKHEVLVVSLESLAEPSTAYHASGSSASLIHGSPCECSRSGVGSGKLMICCLCCVSCVCVCVLFWCCGHRADAHQQ